MFKVREEEPALASPCPRRGFVPAYNSQMSSTWPCLLHAQVNVPYNAYRPGHAVTSNPSMQATPVATKDLKAAIERQQPEMSGGGGSAGGASSSAVALTAANLRPKTAIVDVHGGTLCPDCHCPLTGTNPGCTWYFQCPRCQVC
jgi:hypothetical protein